MAFKKIKLPPKPETKPIPDPNQTKLNLNKASRDPSQWRNVHVDEIISKTAALPDLSSSNFNSEIVKWDQDELILPSERSIIKGSIFAVGEFDPFGKNDFVLLLYSEQTQYSQSNQMSRVYLLNEDLSPVINPKGEPKQTIYNNFYLRKFIGYASSSIAD